jgi:hypothetical protein
MDNLDFFYYNILSMGKSHRSIYIWPGSMILETD